MKNSVRNISLGKRKDTEKNGHAVGMPPIIVVKKLYGVVKMKTGLAEARLPVLFLSCVNLCGKIIEG